MNENLIMSPENHQAFERTIDMLDSSMQEIRRVAHNMMPEILVRSGLDAALNDYCNDINQSGVLQIVYESVGLENETYDPTIAITIYRIVLELITNTIKHADARTAIVRLNKSKDRLVLTIEDDGKDFDTNMLNRTTGIGWTNIQDRIDLLEGKIDVNSGAGKGTSVHIELNF
jgi:signal transduction histidine kinase